MDLLRTCAAMSFAGALAAACGGASNTGLGGGSDAGGDVRASGGDDAMAADSAGDGQNEGSVDGSSDGPGDAPSGGDAANDGPAAACPIVGGLYSMTVVDGAGCGDLNPLAVECIGKSYGVIAGSGWPHPCAAERLGAVPSAQRG